MNFIQKPGVLWVIKPLKTSVTFHVKVNNEIIKTVQVRIAAAKMWHCQPLDEIQEQSEIVFDGKTLLSCL